MSVQIDMFSATVIAPALQDIKSESHLIRAKVLRRIIENHCKGGGGLTADECAADLRLSPLTVRPRFTELKGDGLIKDTGIRPANRPGRSASVMDATSLALNMERI